MTTTARRILDSVTAALTLPADGWEHYYTAMGDSGPAVFSYDRDPATGAGWLTIEVHPDAYVVRDGFYAETTHDGARIPR